MKKILTLLYIIILIIVFQPKLSFSTSYFYFSDNNTNIENNDDNDSDEETNEDENTNESDTSETEDSTSNNDSKNTEDNENNENNEDNEDSKSDNETEETITDNNTDSEDGNDDTEEEDSTVDDNTETEDGEIIDIESNEDEETPPTVILDYNSIKVKPWVNPKIAYLTFDDGPSNLTPKVLDILKNENVKATFFVCGNNSEFGRKTLKRILDEGHTIGNHSYSHNYSYLYSNETNFFKDLYRNESAIYNTTGVKTKLVRLPGGSNNQVSVRYGGNNVMNKINSILLKKGYIYFDWNASSGDAATPPATTNQIIYNVLNNASKHNYPIILMHDSYTKDNTVKALPIIIEKLKEFGYDFKSITKNTGKVVFNENIIANSTSIKFNNTPIFIKY